MKYHDRISSRLSGSGTLMRAATPRLRSVILLTALVLLGLSFALGQSPVEAQADQPGTVTFTPVAPLVGTAVTASLSDPDGSVSGTTWKWAASNTRTGAFTDIDGATSASFTPGEDHDGLYLRATASYTDGHGSGKTAHGVTTVRVNVTPPRFTSATPEAVDVPENTTQVTELKAEGVSTLIRYAIDGGADAAKFQVVSAVESNALVYRLVFKEAPNYDSPGDVLSTTPSNAAGNNEYVVRVRASYRTGLGDSVSRATTRTIIVTVTDVDAPEQVAALTATPGYHEQKESFTVKARWTAPSTLPTGRYKVELLQGSNVLQVKRKGSSATMASFRSLNPGESYKIRVTPHNENADGVETAGMAVEATFTALTKITTSPGAVTDLVLTPGYSHGAQSYTITVEWTPPSPAPTGPYLVQVVDSAHWTWRKNPGPEATKTVFNAYLEAGAQYTVKVTARNKGDGTTTGGVTYGPTVTGTVTTLSPPAKPGAVTNLKVVINGVDVIASWTAPSPAPTGQYRIRVDEGSGTPVIQEIWKKGNRAVFSVVYAPGKSYRVSVTAHNKNQVSLTAGDTVTATPPAPPSAPDYVVITLKPTSNSILATWTEPSTGDPTGNYLIELFEGSSSAGAPDQWFFRKARKALFTGLKPSTQYTVRVIAHNKGDGGETAGVPSSSNAFTKAASAGGRPGAPSNITCGTSNTSLQSYTLELSWTAAADNGSDLKEYYILVTQLDSDGNRVEGSERKRVDVDGDTTSYSYEGAVPGSEYRVEIRARNGAGLGPRAEKVCPAYQRLGP